MKSKLLNTARLLSIFLVSALTFVFVSCDKTETTDSTGFILHYLGVTDIGPSMSYTLKAPAYKGSAPYDFTITNVTFNDETYSNNDNFVINAETGEITIQNTEAMEPGLYSISVGCYSNGKFYSFKDAVQVNMLLAVPEGVSVEPAEVLVKMEDENWWEASAQVTTDAEKHVSITKYEFAEDESKEYIKYFTISNTGVITFNPDHKDKIIPGEKYILSLKLTTKAGEHLYPDAVTFNVISKPLNLLYKPNTVRVEQNTAHESQLPTIQGSEGMTYAIKSITPEATGFTIDEKTGKISLAENSPLNIDNVYKIDVTVTNEYGSTDFAEAYTVTIVDFIEPIQPETFTYEVPANMYEEKAYTIKLNPNFVGGEAIFSLENNTGAIQEQINNKKIEIDILKGDIYILADNTLVPDNYVINAKVVGPTADKGEATVSIAFTISANPNKFTFYYGNNLGLPEKDNANQYAFKSKAEMKNTTIVPTTTLNGKTAKWKIYRKTLMGGSSEVAIGKDTDINETTGELIFKESGFINVNTVGMLIVEATCGTGEDAYTATAPVFIKTYNPNYDSSKQPAIIEYKPFVLQVNPKKEGNL
nr:surface glycan-binding family protein [Bacteroides gallinarum]